jgi:6,7-dimethyl-8-ribityllumazine synthase
MRIGVVAGRFNDHVTKPLLEGALVTLDECGVAPSDVAVHWVPGAFEVPLVARRLAGSGTVDAVVCLGAVIRGDTAHFDYVAGRARTASRARRSTPASR